ncbi:hypothetical protein E1A91_A05G033800v1 [Gossypium mustelinum]|uniref:UDP-glycosyltransferases domain-containing protein n=1 Tax=Gossypium mustelinum TaxID=34275 RepID=A0A5D2Z1V4_GOSMU|nr:hypothetical protein E1A91_A05G033800v1 [Gossypium mustelinum]
MDRIKKLHIAMFPWLAYCHTMPFLEVSKFLAQNGHRISYISTPKNISRLPKLPPHLSSNITFVEFSLPQVDGLPPGVESTAEVPIENVPYLKNAYDKLQGPLTEFLKNSNVNWIIHDFEPYWLPGVAAPLGINLVLFCLFNATALAFLGPPSALLGEFRKRPEEFTVVPEWIDYPCNIALKHHEIVNHIKCMDDVSDFQRMGQLIQGSQFVTTRACFEFEPDEIKLLIKLYQKPVVPVGLLPPSLPSNEDKRDDKWEATKSWLDSKGEKSVFYIALGSEVNLSEESMRQLAFGIEKSNLPFIWAVRKRPMDEGLIDNIIPPGFEERVSNRGLVLRDWAPQLRILAHSSVGGFLTHCGWSSIIEALKFGRALIVFSGASADQGLNARLLHGRKVGIEIERNVMDGSFTSDLVAKTIRQVLVEPEGEAIRANAWAMKEIFDNEELSNNYLDGFTRFIEDIVEFSLPQVQDLPAEVESISELPIDQIPSLKKAYDNLPDPLTEFLKNSNVNWIIHDFAPYWLPRVATLLGINLIFFSTFNATSFVSMGPPSALLGDLQQRPEDFKAVPEDPLNYQHCMDDVSDSQRVGLLIEGCQVVTMHTCFEFEPDEVKLLIKVFQKPAVPVGLLPPSLHYGYSSIGCFLSHGGWSSIIEALKFGRALIVFSGASADQGLNARLLHGRKVGLEIERNETDGSFTSDLVAETIRQVMMEPKGEAIRANAWAMREIFDNEELSNNCLDGFTWIIEEFAPSACHSQV